MSEIKNFGRAEALRRSILLISRWFYKQNRKVENRKLEVRIAAPTCNSIRENAQCKKVLNYMWIFNNFLCKRCCCADALCRFG